MKIIEKGHLETWRDYCDYDQERRCLTCNTSFLLEPEDEPFALKRRIGGGFEVWFSCPHCRHACGYIFISPRPNLYEAVSEIVAGFQTKLKG